VQLLNYKLFVKQNYYLTVKSHTPPRKL
jgi:hypothetical protein